MQKSKVIFLLEATYTVTESKEDLRHSSAFIVQFNLPHMLNQWWCVNETQ